MKVLEITQELEQTLVQIFDMALKGSGMSALQHVDRVRMAIKVKDPVCLESVK
jgi:hypothetical protein